jgi:hypothetical protein
MRLVLFCFFGEQCFFGFIPSTPTTLVRSLLLFLLSAIASEVTHFSPIVTLNLRYPVRPSFHESLTWFEWWSRGRGVVFLREPSSNVIDVHSIWITSGGYELRWPLTSFSGWFEVTKVLPGFSKGLHMDPLLLLIEGRLSPFLIVGRQIELVDILIEADWQASGEFLEGLGVIWIEASFVHKCVEL